MKIKLTLDWRELRCVLQLASRDATRYILNGVGLTVYSDRALIAGCDGRILGLIHIQLNPSECGQSQLPDSDSDSFTVILPREFILAIKPSGKAGEIYLTIDAEVNRLSSVVGYVFNLSAHSGRATVEMRSVDGKYPTYLQVLPSTDPAPGKEIALNLSYLNKFGEALKFLPGSDNAGIVRQHDTHGKAPASVLFTKFDRFYGIIMPVDASKVEQVPSWLAHVSAKPAVTSVGDMRPPIPMSQADPHGQHTAQPASSTTAGQHE